MRAGRRPPFALAAGLLAAALVAAGYVWASHERGDRRAVVAKRGAAVMPFALERTTHVFKGLRDGGVQTVVADDPGDRAQVALIRRHLRDEAAKFERGEFSDPAAVHGHGMPGLAELRAGFDRIAVAYAPVANGGRIRYSTDDRRLVRALHDWFRAQLSDHGDHAEGDL